MRGHVKLQAESKKVSFGTRVNTRVGYYLRKTYKTSTPKYLAGYLMFLPFLRKAVLPVIAWYLPFSHGILATLLYFW